LDIGVLGYIGIVQHKEHSREVLHIPPGTPCVYWKDSLCITSYVCMVCTKWENIYSLCLDIPQHVFMYFHIKNEQKGWVGNTGEMREGDKFDENWTVVEYTVDLVH